MRKKAKGKPDTAYFCVVCEAISDRSSMCNSCSLSYARNLGHTEDTIMSVIVWAAKRARTTMRKRLARKAKEGKG